MVQSLTVDSRTVSKHMSRTSVRHDVILVHDTPRMVADAGRRPAAADGDGEKNRRQPGSPGKPNRLSNRTMFSAEVDDHRWYRRAKKFKCSRRRRTADDCGTTTGPREVQSADDDSPLRVPAADGITHALRRASVVNNASARRRTRRDHVGRARLRRWPMAGA